MVGGGTTLSQASGWVCTSCWKAMASHVACARPPCSPEHVPPPPSDPDLPLKEPHHQIPLWHSLPYCDIPTREVVLHCAVHPVLLTTLSLDPKVKWGQCRKADSGTRMPDLSSSNLI